MLLLKHAPQFVSPAVVNGNVVDNFSLDQYLEKKYVLFFFYPADFSGLCPTEILAFQSRLKDFESLDVQVVGCSTDSKFVHQKWLSTSVSEGGISGVTYPLVSDKSMTISMDYDVLAGHYQHKSCHCHDCTCNQQCDTKVDEKCSETGDCKSGTSNIDQHFSCCCGGGHCKGIEFKGFPMDFRATFLIDKHGIIRHQSINEFAMGRDVDEILRLVEGIKLIDDTGGACPANWQRAKK